jgi:thioredoxin 1
MPDRIRSNKKATASRGFTPLRIALAEKENMNMNELTLTRENFEEEVLRGDLPVLVDFWATWCGPCRMLAPVIAEIAEAHEGVLKVGKVNVDEQPELATAYRVESIPTVFLFRNGEIAAKAVGFRSRADLESLLGL